MIRDEQSGWINSVKTTEIVTENNKKDKNDSKLKHKEKRKTSTELKKEMATEQSYRVKLPDDICSICHEDLESRTCIVIKPCDHVLHLNCSKTLVNCPLCRGSIDQGDDSNQSAEIPNNEPGNSNDYIEYSPFNVFFPNAGRGSAPSRPTGRRTYETWAQMALRYIGYPRQPISDEQRRLEQGNEVRKERMANHLRRLKAKSIEQMQEENQKRKQRRLQREGVLFN